MAQRMLSEEVYRCSNEIFSNLMKSIRNNNGSIPYPHGFVSSYATSYSQTSFSSADSSNTTAKYVTAQMAAYSPMNMLYAVIVPVPMPYMFSQQFQALAHVSSVPQKVQEPVRMQPCTTPALSLTCQPERERKLEVVCPNKERRWVPAASSVVNLADFDKRERSNSNRGMYCNGGARPDAEKVNPETVDDGLGRNWQAPSRCEFRAKKDAMFSPQKTRRSVKAYTRGDVQDQKRPFDKFPPRRDTNYGYNSPSRQIGRRLRQQRPEKTVPSPVNVVARDKISVTLYVKRERDQDGKLLYTDESSSSSSESEDEVVVAVVEKTGSVDDDGFYVERICDALERSWKEDV